MVAMGWRTPENAVNMDSLVGTEAPFFGAHSEQFKLGDNVYKVVEDEDDGYRSSMDYVIPGEDAGFFESPLATVRLEAVDDPSHEEWQLVDVSDGHVWLVFGTEEIHDYYPGFIFRYTPKGGL